MEQAVDTVAVWAINLLDGNRVLERRSISNCHGVRFYPVVANQRYRRDSGQGQDASDD